MLGLGSQQILQLLLELLLLPHELSLTLAVGVECHAHTLLLLRLQLHCCNNAFDVFL
jgi:hypothetical protein